MRVIGRDVLIARGHIVDAEHQRRIDSQNMDRIPKEGALIVCNEKDIGRTHGGFLMVRRGCYKILDTHTHPLLIYAEECRTPGYSKPVYLYKYDFLHNRMDYVEVKEEYYATGNHPNMLSWVEFDIANFKDGYFVAREEVSAK